MTTTPNGPSSRDFDLIEVALESAAQTCQSGASVRTPSAKLDPLAAEYLDALRAVIAWRKSAGA